MNCDFLTHASTTRLTRSAVVALALLWTVPNVAHEQLPIIDMHLHAYPGLPPASDPIWKAVPDQPGLEPLANAEEHLRATLRMMDRHNIVLGVLSGPDEATLSAWKATAPGRFRIGAWLFVGRTIRPSIEDLRGRIERGVYEVLGELNLQYQGISPDDTRLDPYYELAADLGIPVGIHLSGGPPGTPYFHAPRFRVSLGDPILLEPVLLRHQDMKVYLMHGGHPFLERTKAVLGIYPQVHVDVGAISWVLPREEFYSYLRALIEAGFGQRVLFGSDQVFWPGAIGLAIKAIEEAPFLTERQKRDIFYNNAARFLGLTEDQITKHHGR